MKTTKNLHFQTAYTTEKTPSLCKIGRVTKFYPEDQLDKTDKPLIPTWTDIATISYIESEFLINIEIRFGHLSPQLTYSLVHETKTFLNFTDLKIN